MVLLFCNTNYIIYFVNVIIVVFKSKEILLYLQYMRGMTGSMILLVVAVAGCIRSVLRRIRVSGMLSRSGYTMAVRGDKEFRTMYFCLYNQSVSPCLYYSWYNMRIPSSVFGKEVMGGIVRDISKAMYDERTGYMLGVTFDKPGYCGTCVYGFGQYCRKYGRTRSYLEAKMWEYRSMVYSRLLWEGYIDESDLERCK